ncbi:unnamed protein product [Durusdinium trenchii]|uniref:PARP catalytic domain-containing protein n=1 Tax=Durusdinium trenchii TaxID=1381693 RepID=A0ABP0PXV0_9DINO
MAKLLEKRRRISKPNGNWRALLQKMIGFKGFKACCWAGWACMICLAPWNLTCTATFAICLLSSFMLGFFSSGSVRYQYQKIHAWHAKIKKLALLGLCVAHVGYYWQACMACISWIICSSWTCISWIAFSILHFSWSSMTWSLRLCSYAWSLCAWVLGWVLPWARTCLCLAAVLCLRSRWFSRLLVMQWSKVCMRRRRPPPDGEQIRAYHGTHGRNVKSICQDGFRPSQGGMLGPGVYISRDLEKVGRYSQPYRGSGVILELQVRVGKVCIVDRQQHVNQKNWHQDFDTAWVPSNCGMVHSGLEEACIADPRSIRVVRVWPDGYLLPILFHEVTELARDAWKLCL